MVLRDELNDPRYAANPSNRCYFCKTELFSKLNGIAAARNIRWIADGTITDDVGDFRPGMKAVTRPILYMCGEKDGHNAAAMRTMQQEFPAAKYVELPGAGHISNMDQPAMFTKALKDFLGG